MSVHVLAEVDIAELNRFIEVFGTEGLAKRAEHGCLGTTVFTPQDRADQVVVLLEFPDEAAADGFFTDPTAGPIMRKGGAQGPPRARRLAHVATFEH